MEYAYCYLFDYSNESIYCLNITESLPHPYDYETIDEFVTAWGFKPDCVSAMFSDEKLNIINIYRPLNNEEKK